MSYTPSADPVSNSSKTEGAIKRQREEEDTSDVAMANSIPSKKPNMINCGPVVLGICNPQLKHLQQTESRGLRYYSGKVAKKVEEKGHTTYQEVADELVNETVVEMQASCGDKKVIEHKNIRRRIYDALNVLMAMDIIGKDKKDISWQGLPEFLPEFQVQHVEKPEPSKENKSREYAINEKRNTLFQLLRQQVIYRNIVKLNREREKQISDKKVSDDLTSNLKVPIPLCMFSVSSDHQVDIQVDPKECDVSISFTAPFQIMDDKEILALKGFDKATREELKLMMPNDLYEYCVEHNLLALLLKDS